MTEKHKITIRLKTHMMQAMVEAALAGHDLSEWHAIDENGLHFQAICRRCHQAALASAASAIIIPGSCPG